MATVPALTARYAANERRNVDLFNRLLAERTARVEDDYQRNVAPAATVAVSHRWGTERGATPC